MPLLKFALSFIVGISISIQALGDPLFLDKSLSAEKITDLANTLQDVDTTLVDGIPVVNAPCQFHKEASTPFPDDYKFKNPVFHEKMGDTSKYNRAEFTLTPNKIQGIYPLNWYDNCRLVEDRGDNITYKCNKKYYRFQYVGWEEIIHRSEKACLVHVFSSLDGTFNGITHDANSYEWALVTDTCPPLTTKHLEQCLTLDDVRPTLPDPIPECPVHPFTTTPLPKNTQFKNPIFAMEMETNDYYGGIFNLTPSSITYRRADRDEKEHFNCDLIENNMTNITYYCKQMPNEAPGIDGFIRIRSVGFEKKQGHPYFEHAKCQMLFSISPNTQNDLKNAFNFLNEPHQSNFTVKTTSCGPTERHPIFRPFHPMVFPGDMCVPAK